MHVGISTCDRVTPQHSELHLEGTERNVLKQTQIVPEVPVQTYFM